MRSIRASIGTGSLVLLDSVAFASAALEWTGGENRTGIVLGLYSARKVFNLDTDDTLCEVLLDTGDIELLYKEDMEIVNE